MTVLERQTKTIHKAKLDQNAALPAGGSAGHDISQVNTATVVSRAMADPGSLSPDEILLLQRSVGNNSVNLLLGGAIKQQLAEKKAVSGTTAGDQPDTPAARENESLDQDGPAIAVPVGGGHHVTAREVDGVMRLGVASEFTQVGNIVKALLDPGSPLTVKQRRRVREINKEVRDAEREMNECLAGYNSVHEEERRLRETVTIVKESEFGPPKRKRQRSAPQHAEYLAAEKKSSEAWLLYQLKMNIAVNRAKDKIVELWEIGKDYLPTNLMPVGDIFRDRVFFCGDTSKFTYHTGSSKADAIPITWYKNPSDYPRLKLQDGTVKNFGESFRVGGKNFGLNIENVPKIDWYIQKTAHNDSREGQHSFNSILNSEDVQVEKGGSFVKPPLGDTHHFDGDHVKDLGFGGKDQADNYWPLNSTINRRAFAGYNSGYLVHYKDEKGEHKSRSIGGLVGKWFVVKKFLNSTDGAVPNDGTSAGGTPK